MKNIFQKLITILICFVAASAFSLNAKACTTPTLAGSIGDNTANPPDSWITAIAANSTGTLQVTYYNPSTSTFTTKPFVIDSTNGITVTGGWTGSPTAHITSITFGGSQITFNGGPANLTFTGGATWVSSSFNWGTGGGMTQMLSNNSTSLSVQGWVVSGSHYAGATSTISGTCPPSGKFTRVAANYGVNGYSLAIGEGGVVYYWGFILGSGNQATGLPVAFPSTQIVGATALAAGYSHACALLHGGTSGTVQCWGDNSSGQLGDGTTTSRTSPAPVPGLTGVIFISAGTSHTCATLSSGAIKCWGDNTYGELGTGTAGGTFTTPQATTITSGGHTVSAGNGNTIAMVNGRAYTWGYNGEGALGLGGAVDSNPHPTPTQIASLGTTVALVTGGEYGTACSVSTSGAMSCWGNNLYGALGNGTSGSPVTTPTTVPGLTVSTVIPPVTGIFETCAVDPTGDVKCWGDNSYGQVGVSPYQSDPLTPVQVSGLTSGVSWTAAGWVHTCHVVNGHIYCTGDNTSGELGNGTSTSSTVPVLVSGT